MAQRLVLAFVLALACLALGADPAAAGGGGPRPTPPCLPGGWGC